MTCKIGEKIRLLRTQNKMTQEQLAERLGISYQSVSRWENGITYPDIEILPAIAKHFAVSLDYLLGQDDAEKLKQIKNKIRSIGNMTENDEAELIDLIRICRREQDDGKFFESICYSLRYSPLHRNPAVLDELRKSKEIFFETCSDASIRSGALKYYACLEEDLHIDALLARHATDTPTSKDYLLKERYLFRDEFDRFDIARQRYLHKQIAYLIDGDMELWRDTSKVLTHEQALFIYETGIAWIHTLCQEAPTKDCPITCGNEPDVFVNQRIFLGLRLASTYVHIGEKEKAYAVIGDVVALMEKLMAMPDGAELHSGSPALNTLKVIAKYEENCMEMGRGKSLFYTIENGDFEEIDVFAPKWELELLATAEYGIWNWLKPIRKEERFVEFMQRIEKLL